MLAATAAAAAAAVGISSKVVVSSYVALYILIDKLSSSQSIDFSCMVEIEVDNVYN